ncbi:FtsW/RodA/SpoVE family cell cycle protein, partial [Listeria monocytogenes]|nr:FtsW/RodA/SpoVE family cell cycle protein [Listeria monocytogenes]
KGAKSWFVIPFLGIIQPSEVVKVILIVVLGKVIWDHNRTYKIHRFSSDAWLLLKIGLFTLMPLILIMLQPDFGTALVFI